MASDEGLTTWALSPSASFSSTGRMSPRLERGTVAGLPNPAARLASAGLADTEKLSTFTFGSCGSLMASTPCFGGRMTQDHARDRFRATIPDEIGQIRHGSKGGDAVQIVAAGGLT